MKAVSHSVSFFMSAEVKQHLYTVLSVRVVPGTRYKSIIA